MLTTAYKGLGRHQEEMLFKATSMALAQRLQAAGELQEKGDNTASAVEV
jgi:hypothetical protein